MLLILSRTIRISSSPLAVGHRWRVADSNYGQGDRLSDAITASPGEHNPKKTAIQAGQTEASYRLWNRDGLKTGIWEVTPGEFKSTRPGYDDICQILSGRGTIT
jgi:uncharacterized cupin superfamily protein